MGGESGVTAGGGEMAQRGAERNAHGKAHKAVDGVAAAGQLEAKHVAETSWQESSRQLMVGMIRTAWIYNSGDVGLHGQPVG